MHPKLALAVQYAITETRLPRWRLRRWVARALAHAQEDGLTSFVAAEINVRLVGQAEGRKLNRAFRGGDYATNVLTFAYGVDHAGIARGDIVICVPVLVREARAQRKTLLHHAAHLTVHGVLHALGYDHVAPQDAQRMENLEVVILARMALPDPYA